MPVRLYDCTTCTLTECLVKKKNRWELHKDTACCSEQTRKPTASKSAVLRSLTSHLTNHPSQTSKVFTGHCWINKNEVAFIYGLLQMNTPVWANQQKLTSICVDTGYRLEDYQDGMIQIDDEIEREWERERERESQEKLCYRDSLMRMMITSRCVNPGNLSRKAWKNCTHWHSLMLI